MFTHIIASNMGKADDDVMAGAFFGKPGKGMIRPKRFGNAAPAPSAAEVQAIEMRNLAIAAVGYGGGGEQRWGYAVREAREEGVEPVGKGFACHNTTHKQGFAKRRREEFIATGFPCLTVAILAEPIARAFVDVCGEGRVMLRCPIASKGQGKGNVEMRADTQRISELWEECVEPIGKGAGKRFKCRRPGRVMPGKFAVQREQPCPAIGSFKAFCHWSREEREFASDFLGYEHFIRARFDNGGFRQIRIKARDPDHLPPAVDATVPVKAAVKDWVKRNRWHGIFGAIQDKIKLIGILPTEMIKRCPREFRRNFWGKGAHLNAST